MLFEKTGFVYLHGFDKIGVQSYEYEKAKRLAEQVVDLDLKPKKVIFDENTGKTIVFDWCIDHDVCPFLKDNLCSIYEDRFDICKAFPDYSKKIDKVEELWEKSQELIRRGVIRLSDSYEEALEKAKKGKLVNFVDFLRES